MKKLIRNKIPEKLVANGEDKYYVITKCKSNDEYTEFLNKKLLEEAKELFDDPSSIKEMADVLEVLYEVAYQIGYTASDIESARVKKYEENGGFEEGYLLELLPHED